MRIIAHQFGLGDVEDPEVYAAQPIYEWEQTEQGKWLKEHSYKQMEWKIAINYDTYGYKVIISAWLEDKDLTYYTLKWSSK
jgi:hypothetical protein